MMERKDWKVMKLGDFCDLKAGKNVKVSEIKQECDEINKYPCYGGNGIRGYIKKYSHCLNYPIIGRQGALCGNVTLAKAPFYATEHAVVVKPQSETNITWLYYKLRSLNLNQYAQGVAQPGLAVSTLNKIPIPVPPLPVQARIVRELDCLQGILSKKRQQLAEYHSLAQAIFHQMFGDPVVNEKGWEVKRLGEVCTNKGIYGAASPSAPKEENRPRYIRITDIDDFGNLNDDYVVSANKEDDQTYQLETGDILFARTGATVGKTYLYKGTTPQIYAGYLIKFSINLHIIDPTFLFYITKSYSYKKWVSMQYNGVAQPNINARKYSALPIILPPLPLQQSFAARIAAIDSQRERLAASIRELETLLACRMETLLNCPQA